VPLSTRQANAVKVLDWLLEQEVERQTGRTFVIAVSLIRQALRYPSRVIFLIDHPAARAVGNRIVRDMVLHLTESDPHLMGSAHINVREDRFSIQPLEGSRPLPEWQGWIPTETVLGPMRANFRSELAESLSQESHLDLLIAQTDGDPEPPTRYERLSGDDLIPDEGDKPGE